jgi:RNA polymerase sigma factor (sigma-70 family)
MEQGSAPQPLNQITTLWTMVRQAHNGPVEVNVSARGILLQRYGQAVRRYLLGALRDPHAADELAQEFAVRFLRGDLHRADPERGRFRDFVKGMLFHLIVDYYREKKRKAPLPLQHMDPADLPKELQDPDARFRDSWREQLLHDAWEALEEHQRQTGQPFFTVLRFKADHRELRSPVMAKHLSELLGKSVGAAWVRQTLHRARDKYADLLVRAVLDTLANPTTEELTDELRDLGLLTYSEPALKRLTRPPK